MARPPAVLALWPTECRRPDLNRRLRDLQSRTLPTELLRREARQRRGPEKVSVRAAGMGSRGPPEYFHRLGERDYRRISDRCPIAGPPRDNGRRPTLKWVRAVKSRGPLEGFVVTRDIETLATQAFEHVFEIRDSRRLARSASGKFRAGVRNGKSHLTPRVRAASWFQSDVRNLHERAESFEQ